MFLSEWREFPSAPCFAGKRNLMKGRASMLLKSCASLKCFRACFLPGRAKDLSATRYMILMKILTSNYHWIFAQINSSCLKAIFFGFPPVKLNVCHTNSDQVLEQSRPVKARQYFKLYMQISSISKNSQVKKHWRQIRVSAIITIRN